MTEIVDDRQRQGALHSRWRHKARGTTYRITGWATLHSRTIVALPISEGAARDVVIVIYESEADQTSWARPWTEFLDGRFERLGPLASRPQEQPRSAVDWDQPEPITPAKVAEWKAEAEELLFKTMEGPYSVIVALSDHILSVPPAAAEGWQSVPIEPTTAQTSAGELAAPPRPAGGTLPLMHAAMIYKAMLAAAPPSPAPQEQEKGEQT